MARSSRRGRNARSVSARHAHLLARERALWQEGLTLVGGVDEAGMGPLAGPVVAAAVVFLPGPGVRGVDDSKRLAPEVRTELAVRIRETALAWAVAAVEPAEIDAINIYQAGIEAMRRAVRALAVVPERLLVDGRAVPGLEPPQERWIGGDARCHAIAAASILAKTARDERMVRYDAEYPGYGFAVHKGYATPAHRAAIRRLGPSAIHRRSFLLVPQPTLWDRDADAESSGP